VAPHRYFGWHVAERSDIVITMLPDGPDVEKAVLGPIGVLEGARPCSTLVDMSSINLIVSLMNEGKGDYDHSGIVTAIEKMAGIEIAKPA
jgi:NAD binding domain of 6-phosphogluconate dehydrogenase